MEKVPNLSELLALRATLSPERPAYLFLADGEREAARLSWGELDRGARAVAAALLCRCAPGDRALLLYPPGLDFVVAFFGCLYAGVVAVPCYPPRPRRDGARLAAIARDASPRLALAPAALAAAADSLAGEAPELRSLAWLATDALLLAPTDGAMPELPAAGAPDTPAFLQYTSGSTALPKGVMVSHANLLHNERMIQEAFGQDEESVVVGWLPLYHDMGLIGNVLQPLQSGGRCVLMSPAAFLQRPRRWLEAIDRYRGTTSGGPNFAYDLCVDKIGPRERAGLDLSSWRVAFNGAEPVRAETLDRFAEAFAPAGFSARAFFPCYGLAEGTLLVTGGRPGEGARSLRVDAEALSRQEATAAEGAATRRLVSSGRPGPGQRVLVVDPEARTELPPGRVGEIWVSGASVAAGYWGRPEATESELRAVLAGGGGPFLRTGDLGFLSGGELYVTGRRKDLVILRGRNHYPQDLELAAEGAQTALRPGGGAAFSVEIDGEERLVLVFEANRRVAAASAVDEVAAAVRRVLAEEHEVQLHELVLIRQGSLPKTSSGKVQRQACRALYLDGELAVLGRSALGTAAPAELRGDSAGSPLDEIEKVLRAALVRAVRLDPARIDRERPMISYGLDSLAAVELYNAAEAELGAAPSLTALLDGISLAEAARELAASSPAGIPAPPKTADAAEPGGPALPLSFGQQALWILYGLDPASAAYHLAGAARLTGDVDLALLGRALDRLVARHEALRTTYAVGDAGPVQRVHPAAAGVLAHEEAAGWSAAELSQRVREAAFRPFDLERGPVFRAVLFARGTEEPSVLVLAVHHIAADFWSLALLVSELRALYAGDGGGGETALAAPALQPAELARRQRREQAAGRYDDLLASARGELAGAPPLELPLDRPRPALQTWRGVQRGGRLGADVAAATAALGRRHCATLFMVLLAGFEALLARYGGQEDFLVGTPTAGRSSRALEAVVGYLVNPVPMRADLAGDPDVRTLVARARRAALAAMARQELPFALLAEGLGGERDPSRPAVFQAMVALQRSPRPELAGLAAFALGEGEARLPLGGGAVLTSLALDPPGAQFDVLLLAAEIDGDLAAALQVNADLFDAATAERMLGHLASLLAAMAGGDDRRLSALPLLSPAEEQQLVREWNATATPRPAASLSELIAAQAARTPEAVAVSCGEAQLTYGELDHRAGRLARHLERCGVGPEVRVGICLERSLELILALVATLRAGGAFVPIDPSYPAERVAYMLSDARTAVVLTEEAVAARLPGHAARAVQVDRRGEWWGSPGRPTPALPLDGLAYVLYTSGSTGRPKGAMNGHRAIVNRLRWMQRAFPLTAADRVLQKTPASFDVSVWEFFWPLMIGARLVVARPGGHLDPAYLRDEIAGEMVTTVHFVPSLLQLFLGQPGLAACDSLRRVIASGEALSPELAARFDATLGVAGTSSTTSTAPRRRRST